MTSEPEDEALKNLQARLNAMNLQLGNLNLDALMNGARAKANAQGVQQDDGGGTEDRFIRVLESDARQTLMMAYQENPQSVNPQAVDQRPAQLAGAGQERAWGDPQADGSVPAGFEQVTGLGNVIVVCRPQGKPNGSALVVYGDGFAYRPNGKQVQACRFDEVAAIQTKLVVMRTEVGKHEYKLTLTSGGSLTLDESLYAAEYEADKFRRVKALEAAISQIKLSVYKLLLPVLVQRYDADEVLTFGPVTVQKNEGIQFGRHHHAWKDVQNVEASDGRLILSLSNGGRDEVHVPDIPNIELLGRLIGMNPLSLKIGMGAIW